MLSPFGFLAGLPDRLPGGAHSDRMFYWLRNSTWQNRLSVWALNLGGRASLQHSGDNTKSCDTVIILNVLSFASQWCCVGTQYPSEGRCTIVCFSLHLHCEREGSNIRADRHKWQTAFVRWEQAKLNKSCDNTTREMWHCWVFCLFFVCFVFLGLVFLFFFFHIVMYT